MPAHFLLLSLPEEVGRHKLLLSDCCVYLDISVKSHLFICSRNTGIMFGSPLFKKKKESWGKNPKSRITIIFFEMHVILLFLKI